MASELAFATREGLGVHPGESPTVVFEASELQTLISALLRAGYDVIGPTARDGAIAYDRIQSISELPTGWGDEQAPGQYRLKRRDHDAFFAYTIGPQSWKKYLHPAEVRLWSAQRDGATFRILNNESRPDRPQAFLGVRACEMAAIAVQDRVLLGDRYRDRIYAERRAHVFFIAVQCAEAAVTCFCASMGTGPGISEGMDIVLTELSGPDGHRFLARAGSDRGVEILQEVKTATATESDLQQAEAALRTAAQTQTRRIDRDGLKELLYQSFDHPRWENVAARCLNCANCTMVCPTCFCTSVEDTSDVTGQHAERWRRWDSCFTQMFSYIHGGSIRTSGKARYRQWMTHKLAAWIDQFGTSGCVGCGRCITWCPAGIDITEEVKALRDGGNNGNS